MDFDLSLFIHSIGYAGIWSILVAESGLLIGVFLPGDSMLMIAGMLASQGDFHLGILIFGNIIAAFLGNVMGYEIGARFGRNFLIHHASRFITAVELRAAERFFNDHGIIGIVLARFVPIARTIAPFLAGVSGMDRREYLFYSAVGAVIWAAGLPVIGFYLGKIIPPEVIDYIIISAAALTLGFFLIPVIRQSWRHYHRHIRRDRKK